MLVARRDPPLHSGDYDHSRAHGLFHGHAHSSRFMTAVQVIGTLVGIPVGLASAYSIYQSNFAVEARCETLRGSIISMLDKSADASTLRMLVRRDVVTFETNCGAVDPDAVKAFKALLAAKTAPPAPAPRQQIVREPVHQPAEVVKQAAPPKAAPTPVVVEAKPVQRDTETSDANWIASVRDALTHAPAQDDAVGTPAPAQAPPAVQPAPPAQVVHEATPPAARQPPHAVQEAPPVSLAAPVVPALPAPVPVASAPAPAAIADHPVPPGSIPNAQADAKPADKPAEKSGHSWIADIPIVNRVIGR